MSPLVELKMSQSHHPQINIAKENPPKADKAKSK